MTGTDLDTASSTSVENDRMTGHELNRKRVYESQIQEAFNAPFVIGEALKGIRDERLYRDEFKSFDEYCMSIWGISKSRAGQLILASDAMNNLKGCTILPENERQVRPLIELGGPLQKEVWEKCVEESDGKVSGNLVRTIVNNIIGKRKKTKKKKPKPEAKSASVEEFEKLFEETASKKDLTDKQIYKAYNEFRKCLIFLVRDDDYNTVCEKKVYIMIQNLVDVIKENPGNMDKEIDKN